MNVLVAMSGGVDSSVAAALLLEAGHEVTGVTLKLWGGDSDSGCCSVADVEDARRVAAQLGIPHYVFNFTEAFDEAVVDSQNRSDVRILSMIADAMGESIMLGTVTQAAREISSLGKWDGARANFAAVSAVGANKISGNEALLTSWRRLLDLGTLQKGEANLAGTARKSVAVISPKRAETMGVKDGDILRVSNSHGSISLPALVEDIHDDAVWVPRNSFGTQTLISLNAVHGDVVSVVKA